ncbi:MAG: hypothetical protein HZB38_10260 [Planctomycetes bacterium]|nr:hypothetical protein [Planctomycetota bacterium]
MHVKDPADRDRLHVQWATEFTRDPLLRISRLDGSDPEELDARPGTSKILEKLSCKLRVLDFYPHFGFDQATSQPANQSPRRLNPAVRIQLEMDGKVDERWLFSKFPEYKSQKGDPLPFLASIDCASEGKAPRPDFAIVAVGDSKLECWMRNGDRTELRDLKAKTPVQVEGSQYTFQLDEFVPSGQLVEAYQAVEKKGAVTVLCVELVGEDSKGGGARWLEMSKEATVALKAGALTIEFGPRYIPPPSTQPDGHGASTGSPTKPVHP